MQCIKPSASEKCRFQETVFLNILYRCIYKTVQCKLIEKQCNAGKNSHTKQSGLRSRVCALRARRLFAALNVVLSPTLCWQARTTLARLRWSLFCCLYLLNKGRFFKTIISWDCFSNCFVLDCFFSFSYFSGCFVLDYLYGTVYTDTIMPRYRIHVI